MHINSKRLRGAMLIAELTVKELSTKSGVSENAIRRMLCGQYKVHMATVWKVAKTLQINPEELIDESSPTF